MKKNNKMSAGKKVTIGATVVALGAGAYYLLGPNSKTHQKKAKVLLAKMKREIADKATKAKNMTEPLYHKAVDALAATYSKQYKMHEKDIKAFAKKLKSKGKSTAKKAVKDLLKS